MDFVTRYGDIPSNLLGGEGTIMIARMAADGQTVPLEISLSVILNP